MPLYQLADHVDGIQELKAFTGYGVPKQYPIALNGLGCGDQPCAACSRAMSGLGCGDEPCEACSRKNMGGLNAYVPTQAEVASGVSTDKEGQKYFQAWSGSQKPSNGGNVVGPGSGNSTVDAFVGGFQKIAAAVGPLFQKATKQYTVVEKKQDYTTYAVIGGAVIVASVLAIAVGKSRRRK